MGVWGPLGEFWGCRRRSPLEGRGTFGAVGVPGVPDPPPQPLPVSLPVPSPDILKPEVLLPKLDAAMAQVALPGCPKGPPSPGRSRRAKGRHRKAGPRGGCGEPGPEAGTPRGPPATAASPDILGGTLEAAGAPPATVPDVGPEGATGSQGSPPAQPPTPGEPERESGAGRGGKGGAGQHLTPAALLYRAAVTRGQVRPQTPRPFGGGEDTGGDPGGAPELGLGGGWVPSGEGLGEGAAGIVGRGRVRAEGLSRGASAGPQHPSLRPQKRGVSSEEEEGEVDSEVELPLRQR